MCRARTVSAAGYYAWRIRPESPRSVSARTVLSAIRVIHRVARLMRQYSIRAKAMKK